MNTPTSFLMCRGEDGMVILQKTQDVSTFMFQRKPARANKPAYDACYLLLNNNNRVEVVGETVASIMAKLESGFGFKPAVFGEAGQVEEPAIQTAIQPEKEAESA